MRNRTIGFIGGGRITRIFLEGWKRANALPTNVVVSDCNADSLARLKARFPMIETAPGNSAAAASQEIVFLAAHPPVMAEVATGIKGSLKADALVVSLAPKFTIEKLTELLVTLPEATPVHEAAALQEDLRRAHIEPFAWVINQSLLYSSSCDPLLQRREESERRYLREVVEKQSARTAWLPWQAQEPLGPDALAQLASATLHAFTL